ELGAVGVGAQELEEATDVEVVERRLDLVEDVERAWPRKEDSEQERDRGHRLLAAAEQGQALHRLARGRDLDLDAERVVRVQAGGVPRSLRLGGRLGLGLRANLLGAVARRVGAARSEERRVGKGVASLNLA